MGYTSRIVISKTIQPEPYCPFKVEAVRELQEGDIYELEVLALSEQVNNTLSQQTKHYHLAKRVESLESDKKHLRYRIEQLGEERERLQQEIYDLCEEQQAYQDIQLLKARIVNLRNMYDELNQEVEELRSEKRNLAGEQNKEDEQWQEGEDDDDDDDDYFVPDDY